jgi:Mycolic acid cyclopropane synthetase
MASTHHQQSDTSLSHCAEIAPSPSVISPVGITHANESGTEKQAANENGNPGVGTRWVPSDLSAPENWWHSDGGFFGREYMRGDDSHEGFLTAQQLDLQARTRREVDGITKLLNLSIGALVLDCPCGYGRHSIELAARGLSVVGIDINEEHLAAATRAQPW